MINFKKANKIRLTINTPDGEIFITKLSKNLNLLQLKKWFSEKMGYNPYEIQLFTDKSEVPIPEHKILGDLSYQYHLNLFLIINSFNFWH